MEDQPASPEQPAESESPAEEPATAHVAEVTAPDERGSFQGLFKKESEVIEGRPIPSGQPPGWNPSSPEEEAVTGEPWIKSTPADRVGIALSGGGIRSATFSLGILQALRDAGLLETVHYLSTVSGGGYSGSFWTRWRNSKGAQSGIFPRSASSAGDGVTRDGANAIRHLREFSRFLIPRVDLFETELWLAIARVLGGVVFSIAFGASVIASIVALWAWCAEWMVFGPARVGVLGFFPSTFLFALLLGTALIWTEYLCLTRHKVEPADPDFENPYNLRALAVGMVSVAGWPVAIWLGMPRGHTTILPQADTPPLYWNLFVPAAYLGVIFLLLTWIGLWPGGGRDARARAAMDRIKARFLFVAMLWAGLSGLWGVSAWLRVQSPAEASPARVRVVSQGSVTNITFAASGIQTNIVQSQGENVTTTAPAASPYRTPFVGGAAAGLAALFAALRKWLMGSQEDRLVSGFKGRFKSILPNVLASGAVLLVAVTVSMALMDLGRAFLGDRLPFSVILIPWAAIALFVLLVDPTKLSLHEFYRSRLSRCYLGAANPDAPTAAQNRQTFERQKDDLLFEQDQGLPVHLICCAANAVGDDRLSTLYRGARSAVLSRHGIAIGNAFAPVKELWLSAALTASGAAFNSNMGRKSILFGRATCFLMTMMNLRLGLWVRHPLARKEAGGWFDTRLIRELFGWTRCTVPEGATGDPPLVHLSDGGHFENLGLYELVRRHCRYIVVCDAAADPYFSFGDLANAVRRIREDFGVEIEIDTNPLRPQEDGYARQHMVVGTIHYDGPTGIDKGVLLFFKPVLTGDEPTDVLEYKRSNPDFPQQGTGDQFYSEAQWESYRKLGEHAMKSSTSLLDGNPSTLTTLVPGTRTLSVQQIFRKARLAAERVPWTDSETYRAISARCNDMEDHFRTSAPVWLRQEYFPELDAQIPPGPLTPGALLLIIRVLQTLEEVAYECDLYTHWSHPLASGWMNYLHRWTNMPTLRSLWPVLKSLFASGFCQFLEARCGLEDSKSVRRECKLVPYTGRPPDEWIRGYAASQWFNEAPPHQTWERQFFGLELRLEGIGWPLQVGFAAIACNDQVARWHWDDLYIVNTLRGAGFTSQLLDDVLGKLPGLGCVAAEVTLGESQLTDAGERRRIVELVDFYRSRGFEWKGPGVMRKPFQPPPTTA